MFKLEELEHVIFVFENPTLNYMFGLIVLTHIYKRDRISTLTRLIVPDSRHVVGLGQLLSALDGTGTLKYTFFIYA